MAESSVRFSLGKNTTEEEVNVAIKEISETVKKLRS
jgi:cysteine sulfinate desulfinase/cysteine desulfurase-like protein